MLVVFHSENLWQLTQQEIDQNKSYSLSKINYSIKIIYNPDGTGRVKSTPKKPSQDRDELFPYFNVQFHSQIG